MKLHLEFFDFIFSHSNKNLPDGKLTHFHDGLYSNTGKLLVSKYGSAYGALGNAIIIDSGWDKRNGSAVISGTLEITNNGNQIENGFCKVMTASLSNIVVRFNDVTILLAGRFVSGELVLQVNTSQITTYNPTFKRYEYILFDNA